MDLVFGANAENAARLGGGAQALHVCLEREHRLALESKGFKAQVYDANLEPKLAQAGDELAFELSKSWHLDGKIDFTLYNGVSLGRAHEWMLWWGTIIPKVKFLVAVLGLIRQEKPKRIQVDGALESWRQEIILHAAQKHKIRVQAGPEGANEGSPAAKAGGQVMAGSMAGWQVYRQEGAKKMVRRLYGKLANVLGRKGRPRVLVGSYFSILDVFRQWARDEKSVQLVFHMPSKAFLQDLSIMGALPGILEMHTGPKPQAEALEAIRHKWEQVRQKKDYRAKFVFEGMDLFGLLEPELATWMQGGLADYAQDMEDYARTLEREKIAAVVLPFDAPPKESILLQLARMRKIPNALIIHGVLYGKWFQDRYYTNTDELMVWSEWQQKTADLGKQENGKRAAICVTGNPKFDAIWRVKQKLGPGGEPNERAGRPRPSKLRVLLLTDPKNTALVWASSEDPENYLHKLMGELKGLDVRIKVRPHPASNMAYYKQQIAAYPNAELITSGDIVRDLAQADVVITSYSTALFESMLMGKPTLFYNLSEFVQRTEIARALAKDGLKEYHEPGEVKTALEAMLAGSDGRAGHLLRPEQLEFYGGPLDGKSSRRVLDEIERLAGAGKGGSA